MSCSVRSCAAPVPFDLNSPPSAWLKAVTMTPLIFRIEMMPAAKMPPIPMFRGMK